MIITLICNLSTWKAEAGALSRIHGQPRLHNEFQASLSYCVRPPSSQQKGDDKILSWFSVWAFAAEPVRSVRAAGGNLVDYVGVFPHVFSSSLCQPSAATVSASPLSASSFHLFLCSGWVVSTDRPSLHTWLQLLVDMEAWEGLPSESLWRPLNSQWVGRVDGGVC